MASRLKAVHLTFSSSFKGGTSITTHPRSQDKEARTTSGQFNISHLLTNMANINISCIAIIGKQACTFDSLFRAFFLPAQAGLRWKQGDDNGRQEPFFANGLIPNGYPRALLLLYSCIEQPIVHQELQPITCRSQISLYRPHIMRRHGRTR